MSINARIETIEEQIVRQMIRHLASKGWVLIRADDGGDALFPCRFEDEAIAVLNSVDVSNLQFCDSDSDALSWVELVNGNRFDVISDCSCRVPEFDEAVSEVIDWVNAEEERH